MVAHTETGVLLLKFDTHGFHEISLHVESHTLAQELAAAINSIVAKHTAKEAA